MALVEAEWDVDVDVLDEIGLWVVPISVLVCWLGVVVDGVVWLCGLGMKHVLG